MQEIVIASAARTAIGSLGGSLADTPPRELAAVVARAVMERAGVEPSAVDETVFGQVLQAGSGMNVARQAALDAGIPQESPAMVVNRVCGSGLQAVINAASEILLGDASVILAGGVESMSQAPYLLPKARFGYRYGNGVLVDSTQQDGLTCAIENILMGGTAENVAAKYEISRDAQDDFAFRSQQRWAEAERKGAFAAEIVPVMVRRGKETVVFARDEHPRPDSDRGKFAALKPAFRPDGTVTAGNASGINDGAAAVLVMSREEAVRRGIQPMARIRSWAVAGVDPKYMGLGPVPATRKALEKAGLTLGEIDLIEANEAFASQSLAVGAELGWDWDRVNVNGGAIAMGHPIGASGARILVTLLHAMQARDARRGLATLCIGGGQGIAMVVERD